MVNEKFQKAVETFNTINNNSRASL